MYSDVETIQITLRHRIEPMNKQKEGCSLDYLHKLLLKVNYLTSFLQWIMLDGRILGCENSAGSSDFRIKQALLSHTDKSTPQKSYSDPEAVGTISLLKCYHGQPFDAKRWAESVIEK